jgi:hypothetical protein
MTLPTCNDKDYLTIARFPKGFFIRARKPHADELQALFTQHGLASGREVDVGPGEDELHFDGSAHRVQAEDVLESYKLAKGS